MTKISWIKFTFIFLLISLIDSSFVNGQGRLLIQKKKNTNRHKDLKLEKISQIKTNDTVYHQKIIGTTDSTIVMSRMVYSGRDTTYSYTYSRRIPGSSLKKLGGVWKDTTVTQVSRIYVTDTFAVALSDINQINKNWFKNTRWAEGFAWIGVGAILGLAMYPVALVEGHDTTQDWVHFEAFLLGLSIPPMLLANGSNKYDMRKKWSFATKSKLKQ